MVLPPHETASWASQAGLELIRPSTPDPLPLPHNCWVYRCVPPHLVDGFITSNLTLVFKSGAFEGLSLDRGPWLNPGNFKKERPMELCTRTHTATSHISYQASFWESLCKKAVIKCEPLNLPLSHLNKSSCFKIHPGSA